MFTLDHRREHNKGLGMHRRLNVSQWLSITMEHTTNRECSSCGGGIVKNYSYVGRGPAFLYLIPRLINLNIETEIKLPDSDERYRLCGVVYFDNNHFVSRVVDKSGEIWYHDGIKTGEQLKYEKNVVTISNNGWLKARKFRVTALVYLKVF